MTRDDLIAWALKNGWRLIAGIPSLTKPSAPKEPIVRLVLKATVAHLEVRKPAGKWEKLAGAPYATITPHPDTSIPQNLGFEQVPSVTMLMQQNKDQQVFAAFSTPHQR